MSIDKILKSTLLIGLFLIFPVYGFSLEPVTATTVGGSGAPSVSDLSKSVLELGQGQNLYKVYPPSTKETPTINKTVHAVDRSFFQVDSTSQGTSYVVTDGQGRMTGYNPITKQSYSQIPGAAYYSEFSPNEDPGSTLPDQLPSQIFYSGKGISGAYTIDIYSTQAGTAELRVTRYDSNEMLDQIQSISQVITKNGHARVTYQHSGQILLNAQLDFKSIRRISQSRDHDVGLLLDGRIVPPAGTVSAVLKRSFAVSIGTYSKIFSVNDFKSVSRHGKVEYFLNERIDHSISIYIKDDGSFNIKIRDLDLTASALNAPIQVDVQIDNLYGTGQINIKQRCDEEDKKWNIFSKGKNNKRDKDRGH